MQRRAIAIWLGGTGTALARYKCRLQFWRAVHRHKTHRASAEAVATGAADIAAIDAQTWALLERDTDIPASLRILTSTLPTPGLPFICSSHENADDLFSAIAQAIAELAPANKSALKMNGIVQIPSSDYLAVPLP